MRLKNKVTIITGAGRGIGQSMARVFAAEGARVVAADLVLENATNTAGTIREAGGQAHPLEVDVTDPSQVQSMVDETLQRWERLDVLVNNAGIGLNKPFLDTTLEEWEQQIQVNLTGQFLCAQATARVMVRQGYGKIVNVGSISGQRGARGRVAYGAAKAGVMQMTRAMAVELADKGVCVNAISPGPVDTDQSRGTHTPATRRSYVKRIPLHRYGERSEIAAAALFLASDESSFVHGHILNVDGGFRAAGLMFED